MHFSRARPPLYDTLQTLAAATEMATLVVRCLPGVDKPQRDIGHFLWLDLFTSGTAVLLNLRANAVLGRKRALAPLLLFTETDLPERFT